MFGMNPLMIQNMLKTQLKKHGLRIKLVGRNDKERLVMFYSDDENVLNSMDEFIRPLEEAEEDGEVSVEE